MGTMRWTIIIQLRPCIFRRQGFLNVAGEIKVDRCGHVDTQSMTAYFLLTARGVHDRTRGARLVDVSVSVTLNRQMVLQRCFSPTTA